MPKALIIGASRGIGLGFVQALTERGWKVYATVRDGAAVASVTAEGAEALRVDVTVPESLAALGWSLDGVELDLAVYNAGVYGPRQGAHAAPSMADFDKVMHTNVLGAMQSIPLVAPLVEAAGGRFVFISSGMGSIEEAGSSEGWLYRASKAALNMLVKTASFDYPKATMVSMSPGWVRTDMGGDNAALSVQQSVGGMLDVIDKLSAADSGSYRDYSGRRWPW